MFSLIEYSIRELVVKAPTIGFAETLGLEYISELRIQKVGDKLSDCRGVGEDIPSDSS